MAANTRVGHVYVISNIGAFGERMVKIGMTRRQDPMQRVYELGALPCRSASTCTPSSSATTPSPGGRPAPRVRRAAGEQGQPAA